MPITDDLIATAFMVCAYEYERDVHEAMYGMERHASDRELLKVRLEVRRAGMRIGQKVISIDEARRPENDAALGVTMEELDIWEYQNKLRMADFALWTKVRLLARLIPELQEYIDGQAEPDPENMSDFVRDLFLFACELFKKA